MMQVCPRTFRVNLTSSAAVAFLCAVNFVGVAESPTAIPANPSLSLTTARPAVEIRDSGGTLLYDPRATPSYPYGAFATHLLTSLTVPDAGKGSINLTIDAKIQFIVEQALRAVNRGAAVVIDAQNGDVLAMASVPSFDPNVSSRDQIRPLLDDETSPLQNRALAAMPPGSTFTIVTALAGLRKGLAAVEYGCAGGVVYGASFLKCWTHTADQPPHGNLTLDEALKVSCNSYFYQYGNAASIGEINTIGRLFGIGEKSTLPVAREDIGLNAGPEWLRKTSPNERWSMGYTANVSIGQGAVQVTPLQMALVAATVANGGKSHFPRLRQDAEPRLRGELEGDGLDVVRRGMWKAVNDPDGTGKGAQIAGDAMAGKTGTAQVPRKEVSDNHAWFIGFAPYQNPKFAICVLVQGAKSGGSVAAPIAGHVMAQILKPKDAVELKPLEPAKGSFETIDEVNFK
jgi:penicillin-binding protein 2